MVNDGAMANPFTLLWRSVRGHRVTNFIRVVAGFMAFALFHFGRGTAFNADSPAYQQVLFDLNRQMAPMWLWGFWFFIASALMLLTALTARLVIYVAAIGASALVLAAWIAGLVIQSRLEPAALLTDGALGYFVMTGVSVFGMAFADRPLASERPIVAVTESRDVKPLRRAV